MRNVVAKKYSRTKEHAELSGTRRKTKQEAKKSVTSKISSQHIPTQHHRSSLHHVRVYVWCCSPSRMLCSKNARYAFANTRSPTNMLQINMFSSLSWLIYYGTRTNSDALKRAYSLSIALCVSYSASRSSLSLIVLCACRHASSASRKLRTTSSSADDLLCTP